MVGNVSVSKTVFHLRIDVSMKIQCETLNNPRKNLPFKNIFHYIYHHNYDSCFIPRIKCGQSIYPLS